MIRRVLFYLILLSFPVFGATKQMMLPRYSAPKGSLNVGTNDRLYCVRTPATRTMTATKLLGGFMVGSSTTVGVAVYADGTPGGDSGAKLGALSSAVTGDAGAGTVVSATGLSMGFTTGTVIRVCVCIANAANAAPIVLNPVQSTTMYPMLNSVLVYNGYGANTCTSGVTPATTGSLSAGDTTTVVPLVWVED
jgi:hypothetical protein